MTSDWIKPGLRFYHDRVLDTQKFDGMTKQIYQVTKVSQSAIWYRPVYDYGTRQTLGKCEKCSIETWPRICKILI